MRRRYRAGRRLTAALLTVILLGGGAWLATGAGSTFHGNREGRDSAGREELGTLPIEVVEAAQRSHFELFRLPPTGLPLNVVRILAQPTFGMNWALAQPVLTGLSRQVWVVPGRRHVCLVELRAPEDLGSSCTKTEQALTEGVAVTLLDEAKGGVSVQRDIVGIAPDGVRSVIIRSPGYPPTQARVVKNVFTLSDHVPGPPETIEFGSARSRGQT
jgi:hypothetical protein